MPVSEQLSAKDFAARVRQKYPGAYDDLNDQVLVDKIVAKYPQYKDMISTQPSMSTGTKSFEDAHPWAKPPGAAKRFASGLGVPTSQGETTDMVQGLLTPKVDPAEQDKFTRFMEQIPVLGGDFRARADLSKRADAEGGGNMTGVAHRLASLVPLAGPAVTAAQDRYDQKDYAGAVGSGINALFSLEGIKRPVEGGVRDLLKKPAPPETTYEGPPINRTSTTKAAVRGATGTGDRMVERTATKAIEGHKEGLAKTSEANKISAAKHEEALRKMVRKQINEYGRAGEANEASKAAHDAAVSEKARKGSQENAVIREQNTVALQDFAESKAKVEELNRSVQEAVTERGNLATKIEGDSTKLGEQVRKLDAKVRREGNMKYDIVAKAVEHEAVPAAKLAQAVEHAEREIIRGSSENIKQFRELMNKGEVADADTSHPLYNEMVARGLGSEPLRFRDLQGYYTELGTKLASPDVPGDVYRAMKYVRENIGAEMDAMAKRNGVSDQLADAKSHWRQYQGTFHDLRAVSQGGSPVARMLRAQDPGYVAAPVLGKAATRAISQLKAYSPEVAELAANIARDYQKMSFLPKKFTPKTLPESPNLKGPSITKLPEYPDAVTPRILDKPNAPTLKPDPAAPDVLGEIKEARRERILSQAGALKKINTWDLASIGSGMFELTRGQVPYAWSLAVLRHGIGALLDHPRVVEWLSAPDTRDFAVLSKLSSEDRAIIREGIENVYAHQIEKGQPLPMNAAVKTFLELPRTDLMKSAARARREGNINVAEILEQQANVSPLSRAKAVIREINKPAEAEDFMEEARRGGPGKAPDMPVDEKTRASVSDFARQAKERKAPAPERDLDKELKDKMGSGHQEAHGDAHAKATAQWKQENPDADSYSSKGMSEIAALAEKIRKGEK